MIGFKKTVFFYQGRITPVTRSWWWLSFYVLVSQLMSHINKDDLTDQISGAEKKQKTGKLKTQNKLKDVVVVAALKYTKDY